jgi:sporulation protein YlmC with PRC-barrel domain
LRRRKPISTQIRRRVPVRLSDVNLRGTSVVAADGQVIGEVAALFLDSSAWQVESLQVKLRKEIADRLGADRGLFHPGTLEVPVRVIQSVGDTVVLSLPVDGLRTVLPSEGEAAAVH